MGRFLIVPILIIGKSIPDSEQIDGEELKEYQNEPLEKSENNYCYEGFLKIFVQVSIIDINTWENA